MRKYALYSSFFVLLVFVLAGCGAKSVADWLATARSIDQVLVVHGCTIAEDNMDKALAYRREHRLLPLGSNFAKLEPEPGECARYVIYSEFMNTPEAVVAFERRTDGDTNALIYRQHSDSSYSTQLVINIERWANGFFEAE